PIPTPPRHHLGRADDSSPAAAAMGASSSTANASAERRAICGSRRPSPPPLSPSRSSAPSSPAPPTWRRSPTRRSTSTTSSLGGLRPASGAGQGVPDPSEAHASQRRQYLELAYMGKASRKSDVFSFGIMLLEVFTGKRPTNPMFLGESSLRQWVSRAFPARLVDVVDEKLLQGEEMNTTTSALASTACKGDFLVSTFELGLDCSADSNEQRPSMSDVVARLRNIKKDCSASVAAKKGSQQH
uniref:Serine-threonine/tyrosine-protein kinase catalytic domain-containing protein n=1 Tax=Aegilops tauschii subsp. strangulata TaxID=200361 RepID=A0A453D4A3_AEGTS